MQAAIALCYFCENHGPRVVMICQPMRNGAKERSIDLSNDDAMETDDDLPRFYGDISSGQDEIVDDEERCAACSSFGSGLGILSNDHEAETSYVSTQMPVHSRLHNIVKQACLRSLSVEISTPLFVETGSHPAEYFADCSSATHSCSQKSGGYTTAANCPTKEFTDKDGVVLFGDDENGYTLSHTFRLKDAKARGFSRSYSLIVISRDKLMLLNNYEFFLGGFSAMILKLQSMACECFAIEQLMDNDLRLVAATQNVNRVPWLPHQFYPRHFALDTSRSLTEITNNKEIFTMLHRQMLYLLKTQTTLEQDTVLEGVPTQDMLVMMEMERNTLEENDLVTSLSTQQSYFHLYNLKIIVERFRGVSPDLSLLTALIWHVIVGGQVVIKSDIPIGRRLFLLALVHLLPVGCVRLASNASTYIHNYKHNFLGCSLNTIIPGDVHDEVFVIVLKERQDCSYTRNSIANTSSGIESDSSPSSFSTSNAEIDFNDAAIVVMTTTITTTTTKATENCNESGTIFKGCLNDYDFQVESYPVRIGAQPRLLGRYLELLLNPILNVYTLESALRATRNDWLNNAKLIFQLRHQKEGIDINKIIKIIKCDFQDSPILLFWQSGLSKRYKQVVLNTISNTFSSSSSNSEIRY